MFSERYGFKPEKAIIVNNISDVLRTRIWNLFYQNEIIKGGLASIRLSQSLKGEPSIEDKIADVLGFHAGDTKKNGTPQSRIEKYLHECLWYEVFDFVEIHVSFLTLEEKTKRTEQYNKLFEYEKSGYRLIDGIIIPITNPQELETVKEAFQTPFRAVNEHIYKALEKYADRKAPDYENSIKESISAVESMCCIITGLSGAQATLGKTIKKLTESGVYIHPAMIRAFDALYGYASDEDGIRHGGIDFKNVPEEDAKYMLVSCSAFVNYLIEKWSRIQTIGKEEADNGV